jgi:hypothetical protein
LILAMPSVIDWFDRVRTDNLACDYTGHQPAYTHTTPPVYSNSSGRLSLLSQSTLLVMN